MNTVADRLMIALTEHGVGLAARNNHPRNYLSSVLPHLTSVRDDDTLKTAPPPICVQAQVCSRCSTDCQMCDHFRLGDRSGELSLSEWQAIFGDLSDFGVRTIIFSGGEPLVRDDIAELLRAARKSGLRIGLLTNGQMTKETQEFQKVVATIREAVDWVAVSIDGTEAFEPKIRVPNELASKNDVERTHSLNEFCRELNAHGASPNLSATVTLQHDNIRMDLQEVCDFIQQLGIPQVNFKLATGDIRTLDRPPGYLLSLDELKDFIHFLNTDALCWQQGNNLDYLRRTFATEIFSQEDVQKGAPLTQFYRDRKLRCYTPLLFSLIDYNGDIYPCCHLYRDNHGSHSTSKAYKKRHCLGCLREDSFRSIWTGERYAKERRSLNVIDPDSQENFYPCGECTRHCQHNIILNRVQELFNEAPQELENAILTLNTPDLPVWF